MNKNRLHECKTSIELPVKYSVKKTINFIRDTIREDEKKSMIFCKYIDKNDEIIKNVHYSAKKFLNQNNFNENFVINFSKENYVECDKYLVENTTKYVETKETLDNLNIPFSEYETLLVFLYIYYDGDDIFNRKKLLLLKMKN